METKWKQTEHWWSESAWGVSLLSDRLFGKTDKHWTYCLTVCLSVMSESYIETPSSLANCSTGLHSAAWPSSSHHHSLDSTGCCGRHKASSLFDLIWPNSLYVGLCLPVPARIFCSELSLFLLSSCCFFSSVWAWGKGAWTISCGRGMCLCTHTP